jgi:hypothetical protein
MNSSVAIDFEAMEAFVNRVEVELNLASDVINYDLITVNIAYCPAKVKNMAAQFSLPFF